MHELLIKIAMIVYKRPHVVDDVPHILQHAMPLVSMAQLTSCNDTKTCPDLHNVIALCCCLVLVDAMLVCIVNENALDAIIEAIGKGSEMLTCQGIILQGEPAVSVDRSLALPGAVNAGHSRELVYLCSTELLREHLTRVAVHDCECLAIFPTCLFS